MARLFNHLFILLISVPQIAKIINMYTASDEEQISSSFIKNLTLALQKDRHANPQGMNDFGYHIFVIEGVTNLIRLIYLSFRSKRQSSNHEHTVHFSAQNTVH